MNDSKNTEDIEKIKRIIKKYFNNNFTINSENDEYTISLDCLSKSINMIKEKNEFKICNCLRNREAVLKDKDEIIKDKLNNLS
jgi:hypothetical protein